MHRLHTNRAVPHALENILLLSRGGVGALEPESLGTRPTEGTGEAEARAGVLEEAKSNTRRRHCALGGGNLEEWRVRKKDGLCAGN